MKLTPDELRVLLMGGFLADIYLDVLDSNFQTEPSESTILLMDKEKLRAAIEENDAIIDFLYEFALRSAEYDAEYDALPLYKKCGMALSTLLLEQIKRLKAFVSNRFKAIRNQP
jgi:hypothetical protein